MVDTTATEVGAWGWPSEMVDTTAAEVGACGWPLTNMSVGYADRFTLFD